MLPPSLARLRFGQTEAELAPKLAGARVSRDESFGGDRVVRLDEQAAVRFALELPALGADANDVIAATLSLTADDAAVLRLRALDVSGHGVCAWSKRSFPPASACEPKGNRKPGPEESFYCASVDGGTLELRCSAGPQGDELQYRLR